MKFVNYDLAFFSIDIEHLLQHSQRRLALLTETEKRGTHAKSKET